MRELAATKRTDREIDEVDHAFARFVTSGDEAAFGVVFDRTAPRLQLIAWRLLGDRQAAEDLVQAVFLEAIRGAARFRIGAPVMPWLRTILVRRAARHRPKGRPVEAAAGVARLDPAPPIADLAALHEFERQVADAVEALPSTYRTVLRLRLCHGLEPRDIALALERPLGTVHAQLSRGLRHLRAVLPPPLLACCAALLSGGPGLAAMRTALLTEISAAPLLAKTAAVTLPSAGMIVMNKLLTTVATLVVLSWIAVTMSRSGEHSHAQPTAAIPAPQSPVDAAPELSNAPAASAAPQQTAPIDSAPSRSAVAGGRRVFGTIVDGRTGAAIASASVVLAEPRDPSDATFGRGARAAFAETASAVDGGFVIVDTAPHATSELRAEAPGHLPIWFPIEAAMDATSDLDLGTLRLPRRCDLRVRVVDADLRPVPHYRVQVLRPLDAPTPPIAERAIRARTSDNRVEYSGEDGLTPPLALHAGRFVLAIDPFFGSGTRRQHVIELHEDEPQPIYELQLEPEHPVWTVRGRVRTDTNTPVPVGLRFVTTTVAAESNAHRRIEFETRGAGELWSSQASTIGLSRDAVVTLALADHGPALDYELLAPLGPIQLPERRLEVLLRRCPRRAPPPERTREATPAQLTEQTRPQSPRPQRTSELRGTIQLNGALVRDTPILMTSSDDPVRATVDANGEFQITTDAGTRQLWLRPVGGEVHVADLELAAHDRLVEDFVVSTRSVTIAVFDAAGRPLVDRVVSLCFGVRTPQFAGSHSARTDADGRIVFADVPRSDVCRALLWEVDTEVSFGWCRAFDGPARPVAEATLAAAADELALREPR